MPLPDLLHIFLWCPWTGRENCTKIQINVDPFTVVQTVAQVFAVFYLPRD